MTKSIFAIALFAGVAACSAPADTSPETDSMVSVDTSEIALFADLGGENEHPIFTQSKGDTLAVSGYDTVSYFADGEMPVAGLKEYTVRYNGFDYRFASEENANKFIADPDKYAPKYGGYCAWAIGANDALAPGDPNVYEIVDGQLYLNFSEDVQGRWQADIPGFIEKADVNYPTHGPDEHYQD